MIQIRIMRDTTTPNKGFTCTKGAESQSEVKALIPAIAILHTMFAYSLAVFPPASG